MTTTEPPRELIEAWIREAKLPKFMRDTEGAKDGLARLVALACAWQRQQYEQERGVIVSGPPEGTVIVGGHIHPNPGWSPPILQARVKVPDKSE